MTWQDDLRALDDALAAGRVGPDEHRRLRDELLVAASARQPAAPFPPPFRWQQQRPEEAPTAVMPRIGSGAHAGPPADATPAPAPALAGWTLPGEVVDEPRTTRVHRTPPGPTVDTTQVLARSRPATPPATLNLGHDNPRPATGPTRRVRPAQSAASSSDTTQVVRTTRVPGAAPIARPPVADSDATQVVRRRAPAPSEEWSVTPEQLAASLPPWLNEQSAGAHQPSPSGLPSVGTNPSPVCWLVIGGGAVILIVIVVVVVLVLL